MFGSNKRNTAQETPAYPPIKVRKNWKWHGTEKLAAKEIIAELRYRTIEFTDENNLDWAITEYLLPYANGVLEIKVALTPEQDIEFFVAGLTTFDQKQAVKWLDAARSAELVF